ncbi:MAG: nucleoside recognition domain-containing protein [Flavobacteriales bacterium]
MALNFIWIGFFLIAFVVGLIKLIFFHDLEVFKKIVDALFARAELGFEISIGLTGIIALWMGIMKIGENGGAVKMLSKFVSPLFVKLFPAVPENHPAVGSMMMNFSANMLGLSNAATPLGLKAMGELQELNPDKKKASNSQIMFLVLNTTGFTLIPVTIMALRASNGSIDPTVVFLPILLTTFISSLFGLILMAIIQKINLLQPVILGYVGGAILAIGLLFWGLSGLEKEQLGIVSGLISNLLIFGVIIFFIILALIKKVNIFESFIEGAKEGFGVAIKIIPYLIAILCAIGVFVACGAMEMLTDGIRYLVELDGIQKIMQWIGWDSRFVDSVPTALMKPLSGGGAQGMMVDSWIAVEETLKNINPENTIKGPDTFIGQLTSVLQGSTETTFYVLAVYFGSVGIKNTRYAAAAGLFADFIGIIAAIFIAYYFFG